MSPAMSSSVKSGSTAALAAMILAAPIAAPIASADTANCVTRGEFSRIHKGDSLNRVARIFDKRGKQVSISVYGGDKSQIRQYRTCRNHSLVQVSFSKTPGTRYRMDGKYSIWGQRRLASSVGIGSRPVPLLCPRRGLGGLDAVG